MTSKAIAEQFWADLFYDVPAAFAGAFLQFVFSMSYAAGSINFNILRITTHTHIEGVFANSRNCDLFGVGLMMTGKREIFKHQFRHK